MPGNPVIFDGDYVSKSKVRKEGNGKEAAGVGFWLAGPAAAVSERGGKVGVVWYDCRDCIVNSL